MFLLFIVAFTGSLNNTYISFAFFNVIAGPPHLDFQCFLIFSMSGMLLLQVGHLKPLSVCWTLKDSKVCLSPVYDIYVYKSENIWVDILIINSNSDEAIRESLQCLKDKLTKVTLKGSLESAKTHYHFHDRKHMPQYDQSQKPHQPASNTSFTIRPTAKLFTEIFF